jgi:extradiol dioxygenase family protein
MSLAPFHLAFPVNDIAVARTFYGGLLGCPEGRSAPDWVDFDLYGHQIVAHLAPGEAGHGVTNAVDGDLADKLVGAGIRFIIEPHVRFKGEAGEQATMFFLDPSGNALEFKAFKDLTKLFAK